MSNRASWNKQLNLFLFDLEDGIGVNVSTVLQISKHTGQLVMYEGIRHKFVKEARVCTTIGVGLSPEDMVRYKIRATMRELKKEPKKEPKPNSPCAIVEVDSWVGYQM
jgi:hypothetical protein